MRILKNAMILSLVAAPCLAQEPAAACDGVPLPDGTCISDTRSGFAEGYVTRRSAPPPSGMIEGSLPSEVMPLAETGPGAQDAPADPSLRLNDGTEISPEKVEGYNSSLGTSWPMTPEMIRSYKRTSRTMTREMLDRPEPRGESGMTFLTLEPGELAPTLRLGAGVATALGFYDSTGQPWPVVKAMAGDKTSFDVQTISEDGSSVVVTPMLPYGWSNMIVHLRDQPKPVVVRIEIDDEVVDYRRDVQIMMPGPNAVITPVAPPPEGTPAEREAGDATLMSAVSGVDMPAEAERVSISGVNATGWVLGKDLYVRSRATLQGPPWIGSMAGPDGVNVYRLPLTPTLRFSVSGRPVIATVELP